MSGSLQKVPGGGGWVGGWVVVESKFSVQLRPKLNNMNPCNKFIMYNVHVRTDG